MEEKKQVSNKKLKWMLIIGIIVLIVGVVLVICAPSFSANNLEIAKASHNAFDAAKAISANNQTEITVNSLGMGCIGFGIVFVIAGIVLRFVKK